MTARVIHNVFLNVDGTTGWNKIEDGDKVFDVNKSFGEQVSDAAEAYVWTQRELWYRAKSLDRATGNRRNR